MMEFDENSVRVFLTTAFLGIVVALFLLRRSRSDRRGPTEQHAMAMEDVCLTSMPVQLIEVIVSQLPDAEDIARVSRTAKMFRAVPPAPKDSAVVQYSIVQAALRLRLPSTLRANPYLSLQHKSLTHALMESEMGRRKIFFQGVLDGILKDPGPYGDPDMDPFDMPMLYGHLDVPVQWEGRVIGLHTIEGNPKDDGQGAAVFGITGTITSQPLTLTLAFNYDNYEDPSGDNGVAAKITVTGNSTNGKLQKFLVSGLHPSAGTFSRRKCRLRGRLRLDDYSGGGRAAEYCSGRAKLSLISIARQRLVVQKQGNWSESWRGGNDDEEESEQEEDLESDQDIIRGPRLARQIRQGPHPSLYSLDHLKVLGDHNGWSIQLFGKWPYGGFRRPSDIRALYLLENGTGGERAWIFKRRRQAYVNFRDWLGEHQGLFEDPDAENSTASSDLMFESSGWTHGGL